MKFCPNNVLYRQGPSSESRIAFSSLLFLGLWFSSPAWALTPGCGLCPRYTHTCSVATQPKAPCSGHPPTDTVLTPLHSCTAIRARSPHSTSWAMERHTRLPLHGVPTRPEGSDLSHRASLQTPLLGSHPPAPAQVRAPVPAAQRPHILCR